MEIDREKFAAFLQDLQEFIKLSESYRATQEGEHIKEAVDETIDTLVETGNLRMQEARDARKKLLYSKTAACDALQKLAEKVRKLGDRLSPSQLGTPVGSEKQAGHQKKASDEAWERLKTHALSVTQ